MKIKSKDNKSPNSRPFITWSPLQRQGNKSNDLGRMSLEELRENWDINLDILIADISANDKLIGIQIPEGMKPYINSVIDYIRERRNTEIVVAVNPCFGSCDIQVSQMKMLGVNKLFHFGNSGMSYLSSKDIVFIELFSKINIEPLMGDIIRLLKEKNIKNIGLISNVQFIKDIDSLRDLLKTEGFNPIIGLGDDRIKYVGQIIGCNLSSVRSINEKVDVFVLICQGEFHVSMIPLITSKDILLVEPIEKRVRWYESKGASIIDNRLKIIKESAEKCNFGVIISTKPGQQRKKLAISLCDKLRKSGKHAYLLATDNIYPMYLDQLNIDVFISTACPRLVLIEPGDKNFFKKPILTSAELDILLSGNYSQYKLDEITMEDNDYGK